MPDAFLSCRRISTASPSPPLISLEVSKPPNITLMDAQDDDDILEVSLDIATRPRRSAVQALRDISRRHSPVVLASRLRPTASPFIPTIQISSSMGLAPRYHGNGRLLRLGDRIRGSGTISPPKLASTSLSLVDFDISSSPSPPPSRPLSRASTSTEEYRAGLRPGYLGRGTYALSTSSSAPSTGSSRRASVISLPELYTSSHDHTPNSSVSSARHTPLSARDELEIPISTDEEISRLFTFEFKPTVAEEDILVDTRAETKRQPISGDRVEHLDLLENKGVGEKRGNLVSKGRGAKLLSVQQLDPTTPPFIPRHLDYQITEPIEGSPRQEDPGQIEAVEGLLVDLSEPPSPSMKRMSGHQIRSTLSLAQRMSRPPAEINGEGDLIDLGVPVASSSKNRERNDARGLRHRMGVQSPTSGRTSRSTSPSRGPKSVRDRYAQISPYSQLLSRGSARTNVPAHLREPENTDSLQRSLMYAWQITEPTKQKKKGISDLLERLSVTLNQKAGWHGASTAKGKRRFEVDVFGSVAWGGETGESGDLDLIVLDHEMPQGYHPSIWRTPPGEQPISTRRPSPLYQLPPIYLMGRVRGFLESMGMTECQPIISATTPIVKFKEPYMDMECDINVNDLGGWYNSSLILHYCLISPYVLRPMIHALKLWAKAFDLNDPSGSRGAATMSSYCLTLMAIAHLQHRGVLPNLQANVQAIIPDDPAREEPDVVWVGFGKEQGIKAHVGFDRSPPKGWKSREPHLTAAEALRGFFSFFNGKKGGINYDTQAISILQGGIISRANEKGHCNRVEAKIRSDVLEQGGLQDDVNKAIREHRIEVEGNERNIGKADQGIQPKAWEERLIVVQDPFLWQKNCASAMSKDGSTRFQQAISHTVGVLQADDVKLEDILHNPNPIPLRVATPRRGGYGTGGRGRARGTPSPFQRPDSAGSMGSRGSWAGRGRGRGGGGGGMDSRFIL